MSQHFVTLLSFTLEIIPLKTKKKEKTNTIYGHDNHLHPSSDIYMWNQLTHQWFLQGVWLKNASVTASSKYYSLSLHGDLSPACDLITGPGHTSINNSNILSRNQFISVESL